MMGGLVMKFHLNDKNGTLYSQFEETDNVTLVKSKDYPKLNVNPLYFLYLTLFLMNCFTYDFLNLILQLLSGACYLIGKAQEELNQPRKDILA